jgi:lambda repressor-like predicted transcriptional regulator
MGNKLVRRININKDRVMSLLKLKGVSLRGLSRDPTFTWSEKTIRRAFQDGASLGLISDLAIYLNTTVEDIMYI